MTVKQLKHLLKDVADDMEVCVIFPDDNPLDGSGRINETFIITNNQDLQGFYIKLD